MRETAERGPLAHIIVMRDGRSPERLFDVDNEVDLDVLAEQIDRTCQSAGRSATNCTLWTRSTDRSARAWSAKKRRRHAQMSANHIERNANLAVEPRRLISVVIAALQAEGASLRQENTELRAILPVLAR